MVKYYVETVQLPHRRQLPYSSLRLAARDARMFGINGSCVVDIVAVDGSLLATINGALEKRLTWFKTPYWRNK